jgi:hypothetical protein
MASAMEQPMLPLALLEAAQETAPNAVVPPSVAVTPPLA